MNFVKTLLTTAVALTIASSAYAAVSTEQAAKLGASLTAVGAEKAANADGNIPAYTGSLIVPPADFKPGDSFRPDPFANDKPRMVITGKTCLLYTSPSPRDRTRSRMPSSA